MKTKKHITYSGKAVFMQLSGLLCTFLLLLIASFVLLGSYVHSQKDGSVLVNAAGLQRMLMTRYAYNADGALLLPAGAGEDTLAKIRSRADKVRDIVDGNFDGFLKTGRIFASQNGQRTVEVSVFSDHDIREKLLKASWEWQSLKKSVEALFLPGTAKPTHDAISAQLAAAVSAQDDAVYAIELFFVGKNKKLIALQRMAMGSGVILFLVLLAYGWFYIAKNIDKSRADVEAANAAQVRFSGAYVA